MNKKDYFIKELEKNYKENCEFGECPPESKMEYLGSTIFDFTTYDGEIDAIFAEKMVEVLEVILNKKTFDYQEDRDNYINYLTMVNMPFLKDKLEWGTSIRGAWFDDCIYSKDKDDKYEIDCGRIIVAKKELSEFIAAIIEWSSS